ITTCRTGSGSPTRRGGGRSRSPPTVLIPETSRPLFLLLPAASPGDAAMRSRAAVLLGALVLLISFLAPPAPTQTRPPAPQAPPPSGPAETSAPPLPAVFALRYLEAATPVKQQLGGTCWTHGTMGAVESNLILPGYWRGSGRQGLPALSEYHLDWWNGFNKHCNDDLADPAKDPTGMRVHQGGDYRVATAYFSRGDGIVLLPAGNDVYRDSNWYQKSPPKLDAAYQRLYVRDGERFTMGDNLEGIDVIKRCLMTEGALGTCYAAGRTYLASDFVHYQPISARGDPNHAVAIIGWDDNKITKDADKKAPKPGAWLVKNSWGTRRVEE